MTNKDAAGPVVARTRTRTRVVWHGAASEKRASAHYTVGDEIGRGTYSRVFAAVSRESGEKVALKLPRYRPCGQCHSCKSAEAGSVTIQCESPHGFGLADEARFFRRVDCSAEASIVRALDWCADPNESYLVLEHMRVDLEIHLGRMPGRRFSEDGARGVTARLLHALQFIHGSGYMHRDVKPANILLRPTAENASNVEVRLSDFGMARPRVGSRWKHKGGSGRAAQMSPGVQSWMYRAPEVFVGCDYDHKIDVFSTGAILYEMLTGSRLMATVRREKDALPFLAAEFGVEWMPAGPQREELAKIAPNPTRHAHLVACGASPAACAIVERLLAPRSVDRPEARDALNWDYFAIRDGGFTWSISAVAAHRVPWVPEVRCLPSGQACGSAAACESGAAGGRAPAVHMPPKDELPSSATSGPPTAVAVQPQPTPAPVATLAPNAAVQPTPYAQPEACSGSQPDCSTSARSTSNAAPIGSTGGAKCTNGVEATTGPKTADPSVRPCTCPLPTRPCVQYASRADSAPASPSHVSLDVARAAADRSPRVSAAASHALAVLSAWAPIADAHSDVPWVEMPAGEDQGHLSVAPFPVAPWVQTATGIQPADHWMLVRRPTPTPTSRSPLVSSPRHSPAIDHGVAQMTDVGGATC